MNCKGATSGTLRYVLIMTTTIHQDTNPQDIETCLRMLEAAYPACGIVSTKPATKWDFGTCVGNGVQGALAFGRTRDEEIVLSHERMFLPLYPFQGYLPIREHLETLRDMVIDGRSEEVQQLIHQLKLDNNVPGYNTTNPFVGAAAMDMRMPDCTTPPAYMRSVDFENGEAHIAWRDAAGLFHRDFFFSRADDVLAVRLRSPGGTPVHLRVGLREISYEPSPDPRDIDIYGKTIARCERKVESNRLMFRMHFKHNWDDQPLLGSVTLARVEQQGGSIHVEDEQVCITGACEILLLVRTVPQFNAQPFDVEQIQASLESIEPNYDTLLNRHISIHRAMFDRCRLTLSTPQQQQRSGEQMIAQSRVGDTDPALVEKTFHASRYGIIASTGELPPALQGVWTGTWKPRWSGDYTLNGNVQSMVAASLCGNHVECHVSLMDYLDSLMDDFRDNARELLGYRGVLIPWRSSTHGRTHYLAYKNRHHHFPGTFWFGGAAWYLLLYYDYYLHTGDPDFFEQRFKPFLLDAIGFYEDCLIDGQDGRLIVAPDSSPENDINEGVSIAPNPTMTVAGIKQVMRLALRHVDQIQATLEQIERWQNILTKLPAYEIGENGAAKEWLWPGIENHETHRHASHLLPLWFGVDPEIEASPQLRKAFGVAIEERIAPRRPDNGGFMAFGFTQFGIAAAHLGNTAQAYECLEYLANSYWSPIMMSQHNHDPDGPDVLNLDISGGLPALVITMLVQSRMPRSCDEPWVIQLLPCLPDQWPSGSLRGVRCYGGFEVDITWKEGLLDKLLIMSLRGESVELMLEDKRLKLDIPQGECRELTRTAWSP